MRRWIAYALFVVGALLTIAGGLAGWVNRQVLDGPQFVANVDQLRQQPEVAAAVGAQIADAAVKAKPDLVAVKPLIAQVSGGLVASNAAGPLFRLAAQQAHQVLTEPNQGQVVLTIADAGAVVTSLLRTVSPAAAESIPPTLPVTLAQVGGQGGPIGAAVEYTHLARTLAWLLPVLAVLCFVAGVLVHPRRRRGFLGVGVAVVIAGGVLLLVAVAASVWTGAQDVSTVEGAVASGLWTSFGPPLRNLALLTMLLGGLLAVVATASLPQAEVDQRLGQFFGFLTGRPTTTRLAVLRAVILLLLGLALFFQPTLTVETLAVVAGVLAILLAVLEFNRLVARLKANEPGHVEPGPAGAPRRGWLVPVALGTAGVLVVGTLLALNARPADETVPVAALPPDGQLVCNGHAELCDRRFTDVAFAAAHNAMSAEDEGFYLAEQPTSLVGLLDLGVRGLLIDTWYGRPTSAGKSITDPRQFADAAKEAEATFGSAVMGSVNRLVADIQGNSGPPSGPIQPYMCHTFCEIGGTPLVPALQDVRAWLAANPGEVVTIFIQDTVTPADTAKAFDDAGLTPSVYTPGGVDAPWPTLGEMVRSGKRLVVLMENQGGGTQYPWLLQGFDYVQDTGYTYPTAADFDCTPNRGKPTSPLFMINHWTSSFTQLYTDAQQVNAFPVLDQRVTRCRAERGRLPNLIAVNWANLGALQQVVDKTNGF